MGPKAAASSLLCQPQFPLVALHPFRAGDPFPSVMAPIISSMAPGSVDVSTMLKYFQCLKSQALCCLGAAPGGPPWLP